MLNHVDTLIGFAGVMLLLSLLVTAIVQAAVAVFQLRGQSLRWGVALLVKRAIPSITSDEDAGRIADLILKHETVSPHGQLATAIRSDELVRILAEIKPNAEYAEAFAKAKESWAQLYAVPIEEVERLFPEDAKKAKEIMDRLAIEARAEMIHLKAWFDTVMDRTTERFVRWTRYWTIGTAAALCFVLQIDSIGLFSRISGNPDLRARLAQSAEATLKLTDDFAAKNKGLASRALEEAIQKKPVNTKAPIAQGLDSREDGLRWIAGNVPSEDQRVIVPVYEECFNASLPDRLRDLADTTSKIKARLGDEDLAIIAPKSFAAWWAWWKEAPGNHVIGVLITMVFLSLGGPFWYNLLRQLANLRPLLAGKVDRDEQNRA